MENNQEEFYPNTKTKIRYCKKCHKMLAIDSKGKYCEACKTEKFGSIGAAIKTIALGIVGFIGLAFTGVFGKIWDFIKNRFIK